MPAPKKACLAAALLALAFLACGGPPAASPRPPTRDELRAKLVGKTKDEVLEIMGRPWWTTDGGGVWTYKDASYDPVAGRVDSFATVWFDFDDGKVYAVRY